MNKWISHTWTWQIHYPIKFGTWNTNINSLWPGPSPTFISSPELSLLKHYFRKHKMEKLILEHKTRGLVLVLTLSKYVVLSKALQLNGLQIYYVQMVVGREIWRWLDAYLAVLLLISWKTEPQLFTGVNVPTLRELSMIVLSQQWQFFSFQH